jgi:glucose/mannose-6-phosphate isomerase
VDIATIKKIDKSCMYKIYDKWVEIAENAYESKQNIVNFENINHIVFAGMGGSGAIGDIFSSVLSKSKIHVNIVKGYVLPDIVDSNTLVILTSVSGNTSETISIAKSAYKLGCKIIVFSSGGEIIEFCKKNRIEHRIIAEYNSPRASFTSYLYSMLKVLHTTLNIKHEDILESIEELKKINKKICSSNLTKSNHALNLAKKITGIPIIYYPWGLQSAAIRFKNSLQENVKIHVITEDGLETCHNGIVSWERTSNVKPILIEGKNDHTKTKERWKILEDFFLKNNIEYEKITSVDGSILSKLISLIYLFDYATIYKSILDKIDPSPVRSIDFIKTKLEKNN